MIKISKDDHKNNRNDMVEKLDELEPYFKILDSN